MSVSLKLTVIGKKHQKVYHLVAANTRSRRQGKPLEVLGYYNPSVKPPILKIAKNRYDYWLEKGATPTEKFAKLVKSASADPKN